MKSISLLSILLFLSISSQSFAGDLLKTKGLWYIQNVHCSVGEVEVGRTNEWHTAKEWKFNSNKIPCALLEGLDQINKKVDLYYTGNDDFLARLHHVAMWSNHYNWNANYVAISNTLKVTAINCDSNYLKVGPNKYYFHSKDKNLCGLTKITAKAGRPIVLHWIGVGSNQRGIVGVITQ